MLAGCRTHPETAASQKPSPRPTSAPSQPRAAPATTSPSDTPATVVATSSGLRSRGSESTVVSTSEKTVSNPWAHSTTAGGHAARARTSPQGGQEGGDVIGCRVGPVGLEPTTGGLKVRCSTD